MKRWFIFLCIVGTSTAQNKTVGAKVSYLASGSVYVAAGRQAGLRDSATAVVLRGDVEIARLSLVAASSKSSVWTVMLQKSPVSIGDSVAISIPDSGPQPSAPPVIVSVPDSQTSPPTPVPKRTQKAMRPPLYISGRIGTQWFNSWFSDSRLNIAQPGVVVSVHGGLETIPIKFSLYANARETGRGTSTLFTARSAVSSRLYRATIEYDDGTTRASLGRMVISSAPTVGLIDGFSVGRVIGWIQAGAAIGFQPDNRMQSTDPDRKKIAVYVMAAPEALSATHASLTYSKSWYRGSSEREVVNAQAASYAIEGLSLYATADVDLRVAREGEHVADPALSLMMLNASMSVSRTVTLTGGLDASRSLLPFSYARSIPDSLTDRRLRSGLQAGLTLNLPVGMFFSTTYAPRSSNGSFGSEFSEYSSFSISNVFGSGAGVRTHLLFSSASMSKGTGFGLSSFMAFRGMDINVRMQQTEYVMTRTTETSVSRTFGADVMIPLVKGLNGVLSVDKNAGFGQSSVTLFAELSYRF